MKPFFNVQTLAQVMARAREVAPLESEAVSLARATGRTLAQPLCAPHDLPGFDRATMDGYAVMGRDTFGASESAPAYLKLAGDVRMGQAPDFSVEPGRCARIGTGGMLPAGADAVVMVEYTRQLEDDLIEVTRSVAPGGHVVGHADDAAEGQVLLPAGTSLRVQDVGLLAALGFTRPEVRRRPRVGIISSGDEVVAVERTPGPGQVRDVNSFTLAAQVEQAGGEAVPLGLLPDDEQALGDAVRESASRCDLTLLSGGSSVGTRDLTASVFTSLSGAELLVHGVSVAPGKPFIWVTTGRHQLLGLPGQVTSCVIAFYLFVEPIMERLLGRPAVPLARFGRLRATLTRNLPAAPGRESYVRVRVAVREEDGRLLAEPLLGKSGLLHTLTRAQGLVRVPLGHEGLDQGAEVTVRLFP
jgi:molybdopterin molybdotransferase